MENMKKIVLVSVLTTVITSIALFVLFATSLLVGFILKENEKEQKIIQASIKASLESKNNVKESTQSDTKAQQTPIPLEKPRKYFKLAIDNNNTFNSGSDHDGYYTLYWLDDRPLKVPTFLEGYNYILVFHGTHSQGVNYAGLEPDSNLYENVNEESENLVGKRYVLKNSYLAIMRPKDQTFIDGGMHISATSLQRLKDLVKVADKYKISDYGGSDSVNNYLLTAFPRKKPNFTDPYQPYSFYLAPGFVRQTDEISQGHLPVARQHLTYKRQSESMCVSIKEPKTDPCSFSTSGCTCCNTGCGFLDFVVYADRAGQLHVSPLLTKGAGSSSLRFVYEGAHPWLYYTATYSTEGVSNKNGVLDLIYFVDSMERVGVN
jgi:hypothetical protein